MFRSLRPPLTHALRLLLALAPATAFAQAAGVSDERVTLPDGPGSIGGVGANVSVNPAMGGMSHSVGVEVPRGWPGLTPQVELAGAMWAIRRSGLVAKAVADPARNASV